MGTGLRWPGIILAICVLVIYFILGWTRLGFNAYAIGGNSTVSRLSGVKVKRNQIIYYVIGGFLAGLAGVMYTAKFDLATPNTGDGWELQAIAAVVIGGTSLFGGKGGVFRTVVGVLIIKSLETGLIHIGLGSFWQRITIGIVIILAVMTDSLQRKIGLERERQSGVTGLEKGIGEKEKGKWQESERWSWCSFCAACAFRRSRSPAGHGKGGKMLIGYTGFAPTLIFSFNINKGVEDKCKELGYEYVSAHAVGNQGRAAGAGARQRDHQGA